MSRADADTVGADTRGAIEPPIITGGYVQYHSPRETPAPPRMIRHAHLYLTRVDPWSVMKNASMFSIAVAIVVVVATMIIWVMLTVSGTVAAVTRTIEDIAGTGASTVDLAGLLSFGKVFSAVTVVAAMEVVLVTAIATLFAYLYNLAVAITGGLQITLTEDN